MSPLTQTPLETIRLTPRSTLSQRVIAGGIVVAFCYWASSVLMTLLLSILLAYFLDPLVEWLERRRVPRGLGALAGVLLTLSLIVGLGWVIWDRADRFAQDWPRYREPLKNIASKVETRIEQFERAVSGSAPEEPVRGRAVRIEGGRTILNLLLAALGSLYSILLAATFVPFLVFFMLAGKRDVWHGTMQLFSSADRTRVKEILDDIGDTLRNYVAGNALVAIILVAASGLFFLAIGLEYPFLTGLASGLLNMVPYLGALLAIVPPLVVALVKFKLPGLLGIAGVVAFFHLVAGNVLVPGLVGRKVHLNALAVTTALLFWGWMWGAIGFLLAIPITATVKVVCDRVDRWQPLGRWLGA